MTAAQRPGAARRVVLKQPQQHGWFPVYMADLAALEKACPTRQYVYAASIYLTLLAVANEERSATCELTRSELSRRARVGNSAFSSAVEVLEAAGLLTVERNDGLANVWTLFSVSDTPTRSRSPRRRDRGHHPDAIAVRSKVTSKQENKKQGDKEQQASLLASDDLVERFFRWHQSEVGKIPGVPVPRKTTKALEAAQAILSDIGGDADAIKTRFEFARGHNFYSDKVLTMQDFRRWFGRISAQYVSSNGNGNGNGHRSESWTSVRYDEGERVAIS